jgi:membrane-associated phospholipid phosphatase
LERQPRAAIKLELERGRCVAVDKRWYLDVNQVAKTTPWAHGFMTRYYDRLLSPVGAGLLFLALLVVAGWWTARRHPEHEAAVIWTALGALVALGLSQVLAQVLARPRPYQVLKGVEVLVPRVSGFGLPSGRAAVAGAVVCGLLLAGRWRLALVALPAALLLLFAAVYVGVDYPSAVAGGAVFGAVVVLVLWPLVAWLLSGVVAWVGTSPLGRVFAVRGSMKRPATQWAVERPSQRLPDARAMEALRAASEAARTPGYKQGGRHHHVKA